MTTISILSVKCWIVHFKIRLQPTEIFAAILANSSVNAYVDEDPVPLHGWQPPEDYLEQFPLDCWARPPTREELSIFWDDDRANIVDNDNDLVVDDNNDNGKKL